MEVNAPKSGREPGISRFCAFISRGEEGAEGRGYHKNTIDHRSGGKAMEVNELSLDQNVGQHYNKV